MQTFHVITTELVTQCWKIDFQQICHFNNAQGHKIIFCLDGMT